MRSTSRTVPKLMHAVFGLVLSVQLGILVTGSVYRVARRAWEVREASALERSAQIAFGAGFADFVSFARKTVPESAKLVVPSKGMEPLYGDIGMMQYFLRPRKIIDCPMGEDMAACVRSMTGATTYLLAVPGFPPEADASLYRDRVAFDTERGVYVPRGAYANGQVPVAEDPIRDVFPTAASWTLDLLAVAGFAGIGLVLTKAIVPEADAMLLASVSLPLGMSSVTWVVFLLAWVGLPLTPWAFTGSGLGLALSALLASWTEHRKSKHLSLQERVQAQRKPSSTSARLGWILCGGLLLVSLAISLIRSYSGWDDIAAYSIQGYGMAREGDLVASLTWGPSAAGYPLNIQLAISAFHLLDGDVLPGSKLLFPFFLSAILLAAYRSWRRAGHSDTLASGLLLALGTIPLVLDLSTTGYTNLPFAALLLLGVTLVLEGVHDGWWRVQLLGSILLGAAVWTRPEGWVVVWPLLFVLLLTLSRSARGNFRAAPVVLPIVGVTVIWMAFSATVPAGGQPASALRVTLDSLAAGDLRVDAVYWTIRYLGRSLLEPATWGLLPIGFLVVFVGVRWRSAFQASESVGLTAAGAGVGLVILALFYVVSSTMDLRSWLGTSVDRMFLPALIMGWVGLGGLAASRSARPTDRDAT